MSADEKTIADLMDQAHQARRNAYAPYSNYAVGAAVLARSGQVYVGANVENAAYPTTMCAERSAVFSAVAKGERSFDVIVVMTENGVAPCGACRQVLSEFGLDLQVVTTDAEGNVALNTRLAELIPDAFGPQDLIIP
jgi:cytidine deaminase